MHSVLKVRCLREERRSKLVTLKGWKPSLSNDGRPTVFHNAMDSLLRSCRHINVATLEQVLFTAGTSGGTCQKHHHNFKPSSALQSLRHRRRASCQSVERKILTFQIRRLHRAKVRHWRACILIFLLEKPDYWRHIRHMEQKVMGKHVAEQCTPDEFANALEGLFAGNPMEPQPPLVLDELPWALHELDRAIKALKTGKAADDGGLVAELLENSSDGMLLALVSLYNQVLFTGDVPPSWHKTLFTMLPKKSGCKNCNRFPANCKFTFALQDVRLHDFASH